MADRISDADISVDPIHFPRCVMSRSYALLLPWAAVCLLTAELVEPAARAEKPPRETIKVGILHSLTGTLAILETAAKDAELLAIEEINKAGGLLGKQIEAIVE